ncbi:MAG TPA: serine/threonine-protein kinase [Desulfobacteraceae bacterium]|nr:serine/threonine-protein kinase [Desulfobacteraceae bacterium]
MNDSQTMIQNALGDKYEIKELIQSGGMGKIFLGIHKALGKKVAIKIVHQELVKKEQFKARFYREAKLAAGLDHPGIIDIYDFGSSEEFDYIIMPYIDGETFQSRIKREGPFEVQEAVRLMIEITEALHHAHQRNVVHRDIKPSNIMFDSRDRAVITDFGISKDLGDNELTAPNTVLGSPKYMSPEQIRGEPVDARSDLYSLGLVFYEMVTGKHPFEGKDTSALYYSQAHEMPSRPESNIPQIPRELGNIIMRLLEKLPEKRYADGEQVVRALRDFQRGKVPAYEDIDEATVVDSATIVDEGTIIDDGTVLAPGDKTPKEHAYTDKKASLKVRPTPIDFIKEHRKLFSIAAGVLFIFLLVIIMLPGGTSKQKGLEEVEEESSRVSITPEEQKDKPVFPETASLTAPDSEQAVPEAVSTEKKPETHESLMEKILSIGNGRIADKLTLWTDKTDYNIGQPMSFFFETREPCYILIFTYTTKKELIQVFPNYYSSSQFIQPERKYSIPNERMGFDLHVTGPAGKDTVVALVSTSPLELFGTNFSENDPFLSVDTRDTARISDILNKIISIQHQDIKRQNITYNIN